MIAITLKLQHHIDNMLQNLRAGNSSVFGDMTDDKYRGTRRLGIFQQRSRTLSDLRHTTRRRVQRLGINRLNRVNHHYIGLMLLNLHQDIFEQCFRIDVALLVAYTDTLGTHLNLLGRLLARDI